MDTILALVDCNNFYVSCERVFNAAIHKTPVIVLSNNDGCVNETSPIIRPARTGCNTCTGKFSH